MFGDSIDTDEEGEEISGDTVLILFNADHGLTIPFTLPKIEEEPPWQLVVVTIDGKSADAEFAAQAAYPLRPCSMAVFRVAATGNGAR